MAESHVCSGLLGGLAMQASKRYVPFAKDHYLVRGLTSDKTVTAGKLSTF